MLKMHYQKELTPPAKPVQPGDKGADAKRVQEWINLWRYYDTKWNLQVTIDGDYGPTSQLAVKQFQQYVGVPANAIVDERTWSELVRPLREAFAPIDFPANADIRTRVVSYAQQQLRSRPHEFSPNMGPWVRSYMDGREGEMWMWCVGFSQTILDLAYGSMGKKYTDAWPQTFIANAVRDYGRTSGRLVSFDDLKAGKYKPQGGDVFMNINPKDTSQAYHVGLVISFDAATNTITTIEGNVSTVKGGEGVAVGMLARNFAYYVIDIVKLV